MTTPKRDRALDTNPMLSFLLLFLLVVLRSNALIPGTPADQSKIILSSLLLVLMVIK